MFKNANISYENKNSKRPRYYAKFQDLALKHLREIFYEMDPWLLHTIMREHLQKNAPDILGAIYGYFYLKVPPPVIFSKWRSFWGYF